jgi:LPS export ABC transporter permease LptF
VKTLHWYLTRQVIASLLMTLLVFIFVLLLGNVLKQILTLLVNRQVTVEVVVEAVGLLIPWVLVFALPLAMLTATLLVFGRFSADQELVAARASGISLLSLITPILLLSVLLSGVCAVVNMEIAPRCRAAYKDLLFNFQVELLSAYLPEGRFITDSRGYTFYVGKNRDRELQDIIVFQDEGTNGSTTLRAPRGRLYVDASNHQASLMLYNAKMVKSVNGKALPATAGQLRIDLLNEKKQAQGKPSITDLTFTQLQDEIHALESRVHLPSPSSRLSSEQLRAQRQALEKQRSDLTSPLRVQIHREVAFSFACFGFTLIGIPLGIRIHRRESNISFAVALVLVLIYYCFIVLSQSLATRPELAPQLIVWLPNFIFQSVGAVMLWRANRGL